MNKIVGILGSIISFIGVIFQFFDKTMGWWQEDISSTLLGSTSTVSHYFNLLGVISSSNSSEHGYPLDIASKTIIYIILLLVIVGAIILFIGGAKGNNVYGILGAIILIGALVYFAYSLPNIPEIVDELHAFSPSSYLYGNGEVNFIIDIKDVWRLGNGFFITTAGAIIGIIGCAIKSK